MTDNQDEGFSIAPISKRNGLTLMLASTVLVCLALGIFIGARQWFGPALVLFGVGAVGAVLGYAKMSLPSESLRVDKRGLHFFHRRGSYQLEWENILRIDVPRVSQGLDSIDLPFIGIKLKKINPVLDVISPRLATGLLSEQRPLLMTASAQQDVLDALEAQMGAEFTPLITHGERYRGVLAMFGHRCLMLDQNLGYHLYIPADVLDDEPAQVARRLRSYKAGLPFAE